MQKRVKKKITKKVVKKVVKKKVSKAKAPAFKFSLSDKTLSSAISALKELDKRQKGASKDLLSMNEDSLLYLTMVVNTLPEKINIKPTRIEVPNGLYGGPEKQFCMIVSDEFKKKFKSQLSDPELSAWKFLRYDKLRRNFKTFAEKRTLFDSYDLFFCEGRVYMLIKKMLGKKFYERKKYPFPIEFDACLNDGSKRKAKKSLVEVLHFKDGDVEHLKSFENHVLDIGKFKQLLGTLAQNSTYFYQGNGPEYTLKISRISAKMSNRKIIKNVRVGTKFLLKYMISQGMKLKSIRRICLKLGQSESFPVYSYLTPKEKGFMRKAME